MLISPEKVLGLLRELNNKKKEEERDQVSFGSALQFVCFASEEDLAPVWQHMYFGKLEAGQVLYTPAGMIAGEGESGDGPCGLESFYGCSRLDQRGTAPASNACERCRWRPRTSARRMMSWTPCCWRLMGSSQSSRRLRMQPSRAPTRRQALGLASQLFWLRVWAVSGFYVWRLCLPFRQGVAGLRMAWFWARGQDAVEPLYMSCNTVCRAGKAAAVTAWQR